MINILKLGASGSKFRDTGEKPALFFYVFCLLVCLSFPTAYFKGKYITFQITFVFLSSEKLNLNIQMKAFGLILK